MVRNDPLHVEYQGATATAHHHDHGWEVGLSADRGRLDVAAGTALLTQLVEAVTRQGGGPVRWRIPEPTPEHQRVARSAGFDDRRRLVQLRRPLPLPTALALVDPSFTTRSFDKDRDIDRWLEVNNAAFAWHPEQGDWSVDDLRETMAEPWFDPAGFLVHPAEGPMRGFCWTKVHSDFDPPIGEIFVIAVHPDHHGQGLGRALVVAGLDHLADQGITEAMLYTEADNGPALQLYESLGFTLHHHIVVFERRAPRAQTPFPNNEPIP